MSFELTGAQREFFATFGYLHLPGLFADESTRIEDAFEELIRRHGGDGHDGRERCISIRWMPRAAPCG